MLFPGIDERNLMAETTQQPKPRTMADLTDIELALEQGRLFEMFIQVKDNLTAISLELQKRKNAPTIKEQ